MARPTKLTPVRSDERSFVDAQSNGETTSGEKEFREFRQSVARVSAEAEPEFAEGFSDTPRDRAHARGRWSCPQVTESFGQRKPGPLLE